MLLKLDCYLFTVLTDAQVNVAETNGADHVLGDMERRLILLAQQCTLVNRKSTKSELAKIFLVPLHHVVNEVGPTLSTIYHRKIAAGNRTILSISSKMDGRE